GTKDEDVERHNAVEPLLLTDLKDASTSLGGEPKVVHVKVAGEEYVATASRLPLNFSDKTAGAMVMMSLSTALDPVASVKLTILLLGLGALVIAVLGMLI